MLSTSAARSSFRLCTGTGGAGGLEGAVRRTAFSGRTSATALRNSSSSMTSRGEQVQVFLRVERSHASGRGAGHRLPVDVVLHVAGGEYARNARGSRVALASAVRDDVAAFHLDMALEDLRVGR